MQEVELSTNNEQRALMWLLNKTIQHHLANDIADTVDGDLLDGQSLDDILSAKKSLQQIKKSSQTYFEELLDPRMLDELIMILLLIGTDHDGPENYCIKQLEKKKYRLECFGRSPVFCKVNRSILFCFDQMQKPIHPDAIKTILQLHHNTIHDFLETLVNSKTLLRHRFAEEIHLRFSNMKRILAQNSVLTHLELMAQLDPALFSVYECAFEKADIMSRYQHIAMSTSAINRKTSSLSQQNEFKEF